MACFWGLTRGSCAVPRGGKKRIPGVKYHQKALVFTQRLAWRAAVDAAETVAQLGLALRTLDDAIKVCAGARIIPRTQRAQRAASIRHTSLGALGAAPAIPFKRTDDWLPGLMWGRLNSGCSGALAWRRAATPAQLASAFVCLAVGGCDASAAGPPDAAWQEASRGERDVRVPAAGAAAEAGGCNMRGRRAIERPRSSRTSRHVVARSPFHRCISVQQGCPGRHGPQLSAC
jgi:hypothetical protein